MSVESEIRELARTVLRPAPTQPIADWAAEHVYLDGDQTATPGFYRPDDTPFNRRVMEAARDPEVNEVTIMKSSRTGTTEAVFNVLRWHAVHAPGHALYAISSRDEAREIMEDRIRPTVLRCLGADRRAEIDEEEGGVFSLPLPGMRIRAVGGGSEAPFSNKWLKLGIIDEPEDHPLNKRTTASATTVALMRTRFATVPGYKMFVIGNPSTPEGLMNREFQRGSMEEWECPCPHCGHYQELNLRGLQFAHLREPGQAWNLTRVLEEAAYKCAACKELIPQSAKPVMIGAGRSVARNPHPHPGVVSLHLSDLLSPYRTWGELAVEWLGTAHNESERKTFYNKRLGLPFELSIGRRTIADLLALRGGLHDDETGETIGPRWEIGEYRPAEGRVIPVPIVFLAVAIDVQTVQGVLKATVGGYTEAGEILILDYGEFADESREQAMEDWLSHGWHDLTTGERRYLDGGWRDAGDQATEQVEWCLKNFERFGIYPSRGRGSYTGPVVYAKEIDHKGLICEWYWYDDNRLKEEFYLSTIARRAEPRLWFPHDIGDHPAFLQEWTTERRVKKTTPHGSSWKWDTGGKPNDGGDTGKMLAGIRHVLAAQGVIDLTLSGDEDAENLDDPGEE